jgi:hypothetical protein
MRWLTLRAISARPYHLALLDAGEDVREGELLAVAVQVEFESNF